MILSISQKNQVIHFDISNLAKMLKELEAKTFEQDLVENDSIWSDVSISNASNTIKKWFK